MSAPQRFHLRILPEPFVVERLDPNSTPLLAPGSFSTLIHRGDEVTRIRPEGASPDEVLEATPGWRALVIDATFDFEAVGVLATIAAVLAEAHVPLLAVSTWATDVILVSAARLDVAVAALRHAGHTVDPERP